MTTTTDEADSNHLEHEGHEQFLTFTLDDEEYGVDILSVQEIRGWELPTFLPNSPGYIKGVINLRGMIVPIMDLRERFDVGELTYNEQTVVIVVRCCSAVLNRVIGMVVDSVSEVVSLAEHAILSSP
jgi:purine-binding chemotaxis protein CheW